MQYEDSRVYYHYIYTPLRKQERRASVLTLHCFSHIYDKDKNLVL